MRRIYIATGLERANEARALSLHLKSLGHTITYEWWWHGSVQSEGPERIAEVAKLELNGIRDANCFIALLPGGRGTHTEFGYAIGTYCPQIVLIGPTEDDTGRTCSFYLHYAVTKHFNTIPEFLDWVGSPL